MFTEWKIKFLQYRNNINKKDRTEKHQFKKAREYKS